MRDRTESDFEARCVGCGGNPRIRDERDLLRSALRAVVRAQAEGMSAYRDAIAVLGDIAGREEKAKADHGV